MNLKKVFSVILLFFLVFSSAVQVRGAETDPAIALTKYTDGIVIKVQKAGTIQSIQLSVQISGSDFESLNMAWDKSLSGAYAHYETQAAGDGIKITFYVDSQTQLNDRNDTITLGRLVYQGYNNQADVSSDGAVKTLNLGLQEKNYEASVVVSQSALSSAAGSGSTDIVNPGGELAPMTDNEVTVDKNQNTLVLDKLILDLKKGTNKIVFKVPDIKLWDSKQPLDLKLSLENAEIYDFIKEIEKERVIVEVTLPDSVYGHDNIHLNSIILPNDLTNFMKKQNKSVAFHIKNAKAETLYSVSFQSKTMKVTNTDTDIALKAYKPLKNSVIGKTTASVNSAAIQFTQKTAFCGPAEVTLNVSRYGFKSSSQLHLNKYMKGKPLIYQSKGNKVRADGTVTFTAAKGGTYLLTTEGFVKSGQDTKYYNGNTLVKGFKTVNGNTYYFGKDGKAVTGKQKINGRAYQFDKNGILTVKK